MPGVTYGQKWSSRSAYSSDLKPDSSADMAPQKKHDLKGSGASQYSNGHDRNSDLYDYYPTYLLEHLATFSVGSQYGIQSPKDGLRRLLQMEKSSGIWTQKMQMRLEKKWVVIIDNENGDIVERFPMNLISEPTSYTSNDPRELYNNVIVFIVKDDPKSKNHNPPEMHIFQCARVSAQEVVNEMKMFISGKWKPGAKQTRHIPPPPTNPPPDPPVNGVSVREQVNLFNAVAAAAASPPRNDGMIQRVSSSGYQKVERMDNGSDRNAIYSRDSNDETSSTSSEKYERDVAILNHCFDDIERFIARLQHAAAAFKELERRQKSRKNKKKDLGDGMLSMRAKPPLEREFVDILQKFKLSFNLLAKLKSHIHDPNAPELVHFLFTPLTLIVDAAKDSNYSTILPSRVVSPLLTKDAVELLMNCCTSKENDFWHSLGDSWVIPREQWKGFEAKYHPVFSDGWAPEYPFADKRVEATAAAAAVMASKIRKDEVQHSREEHSDMKQEYRVPSRQEGGSRYGSEFHYSERGERAASPGHSPDMSQQPYDTRYYSGHNFEMSSRDHFESRNGAITPVSDHEFADHRDMRSDFSADSIDHVNPIDPHRQLENQQKLWLEDMKSRGAKVVQVMYPRTANNDKELTVVRGEYLEVIDDSRKWWKARNAHGQVAHVPHTIVGPVSLEEDGFNNPIYGSRTNGSKDALYTPSDSPVGRDRSAESGHREPAPQTKPHPVLPNPAPADWIKRERQGKKGCQVYEELQAGLDIADAEDVEGGEYASSAKICSVAESVQSFRKPITQKSVTSSQKSATLPKFSSTQDLLHEELKKRVTLGPKSGIRCSLSSDQQNSPRITQDSRPEDVQLWLGSKKFSARTQQFLQNLNGKDIFLMTKEEMEKDLSDEEATRLFNQVTIQKNICGFTLSRQNELSSILRERRKNLDSTEQEKGKIITEDVVRNKPNVKSMNTEKAEKSAEENIQSTRNEQKVKKLGNLGNEEKVQKTGNEQKMQKTLIERKTQDTRNEQKAQKRGTEQDGKKTGTDPKKTGHWISVEKTRASEWF